MSANAQDFDFGEYDKPGIERSRRRRGEDDALESDLEEDLLEEDWLSGKKNTSEVSDEELNDDLLQSDDEDLNMTGQDASLGMDASYDQQGSSQEADYPDDVVNLGAEGCDDEEEEGGGHHHEGEVVYTEGFRQEDNTEMPEDYAGDLAEDDDGYQDEVLDIQITEPLDGEFQDEDYQSYGAEAGGGGEAPQEEDTEEVGGEKQLGEEDINEESHVYDTEEGENDTLLEDKTKEESDEEEDDGEDSGRIRFKSERKEGVVVRLADAGQRRNIPETLELSEKAKRDLMEFEEQERQRRQTRYGGRGRGGGRGGRGRGGFPGFGMPNFRGQRRKMHDQMPPLMGNMIMQQSSRMPHPHQQQMQSHQHHPSHPRGPPPPFQEHGRPLSQQPLQPLLPPHMAHRSPPLRPQMEQPPRMMGSPPPAFPPHHQQQQQQPPPPQSKNIHINPHFRGSVQSSVQVPLMPPAQSQSRPAVGPQRFPGMGEFQQHMPGNFGPPQRPPHFMEPLKTQPPQGPRDREPQFMGDRGEAARFPAQHMFDHQVPGSLNNSSSLHQQQQQQLPGQGHLGFGPPAPPFNQPNQGPLGLFQREPPRPNLPPHQGHQGMMNLNQQGGPPNQPRPFMSPRQPFGQQGNLFPPPQVQFGMQGLMHAPPVPQLPHHDTMSPLPLHQQQQHHRQDLPHQQQINLGESRPMTHHGQNLFHQQHGSPRQMTPRPQNPQQRNMSNRQRMNTPISKQMQQRNSNLRELPVAPANTNMNNTRPTPTPASQAANIRPVARATLGTRPGQNAQPTSGGGRGRGQAPNTFSQHGGAGRTVVTTETLSSPSQSEPQDPDEDEETRQYRLKIEEQKRLREEILRKKELRRQMQAGVRKKELLERLNSQTNTPNQGPAPTQTQPLQFNQPRPHPVQPQQQLQQPLLPQPPLLPHPPPLSEQTRPQLQAQHQRPAPQRMPQMLNTLRPPNQDNALPPSGTAQTPAPRSNVKSRLQMVKGFTQEQQSPGVAPEQQWKDPQQQRRNNSVQIVNRLGAPAEAVQVAQNASRTQGPGQTQGPRPPAKRTVMQRVSSSGVESQQVPQKVRVVKLSGMSGTGPEATSGPVQQQSSWQASPLNQSVQRKVTMMGQQQQGPGGAPQASRGGRGSAQQSRVVVTGRGQGRGGGQMGRGHPVSVQQNLSGAETPRCTVSIKGLSSSTSEIQLKNLLKSIGPIEMFKMMPQQRKAVATFSNAQHAADFQSSFNRHMIDLSHIEVSLIDG